MIGLVLSIVGILAVWALTKSFPEIEAKLKSFAHVGYLLWQGGLRFHYSKVSFSMQSQDSNITSARSQVRKKWFLTQVIIRTSLVG